MFITENTNHLKVTVFFNNLKHLIKCNKRSKLTSAYDLEVSNNNLLNFCN